jgi:hypothetical protein
MDCASKHARGDEDVLGVFHQGPQTNDLQHEAEYKRATKPRCKHSIFNLRNRRRPYKSIYNPEPAISDAVSSLTGTLTYFTTVIYLYKGIEFSARLQFLDYALKKSI